MTQTLTPNLKQYEQNLSSTERRRLDMIQQVLNVHSNGSNEKENICDLFKTYANLIKESKKSNATLPLERSEISFRDKHTLKMHVKSLENNNPQSFLIMPLYSNNHMFATVIRKRGDKFVSTIVNKGDRPSMRGQFVEHTLSESGIEELINDLHNNMGEKATRTIYSIFNKHSDSHRILNMYSRDQKVGNCYIKEPENAIKYALATMDFTNEQFDDLFQNKIHFKPKWDELTVNTHRRLVEDVAKEHPNMIPVLQSEMYVYEINKQFREAVEKNVLILPEKINEFLPYVNIDTLSKVECIMIIGNALDKLNDSEKMEELRTLNQMANSNPTMYGHKRFFDDLGLLESKYPVLARQIKYEQHSDLLMSGLDSLDTALSKQNPHTATAFRYLHDSIRLYPNNFMSHAALGVGSLETHHYETALKQLNKAIELKDGLASLYYLRSQVYSKLNNPEMSHQDLKAAKSLEKGCAQKWKNEKNLDILCEYYGLGYKPQIVKDKELNKDSTGIQKILEKGNSNNVGLTKS